MDTEAGKSRISLSWLAGLVAIAATFAGSASISDRSGPTGSASLDPAALTREAAQDPPGRAEAPDSADDGAPELRLPVGRSIRRNLQCTGCGVVETMSRIDRRGSAGDVCSSANFDHLWTAGTAAYGGEWSGASTLSDTVKSALSGRPVARSVIIASSYQIVIRLHDGSHQVFDEATARSLRSGERVQVIAGIDSPSQ